MKMNRNQQRLIAASQLAHRRQRTAVAKATVNFAAVQYAAAQRAAVGAPETGEKNHEQFKDALRENS